MRSHAREPSLAVPVRLVDLGGCAARPRGTLLKVEVARSRRTPRPCRRVRADRHAAAPSSACGCPRAYTQVLVQLARLRLALAKQHEVMLQYIPKLAAESFVFVSDLYDCPQPELEALLAKVEMKVPHAKLLRALLAVPQPPYNREFAAFAAEPELPPNEFLAACGLPEYTEHLTTNGYEIVQFLLDATQTELADLCARMRPVERRRFIGAVEHLQHEAEAAKVAAPPQVRARSSCRPA